MLPVMDSLQLDSWSGPGRCVRWGLPPSPMEQAQREGKPSASDPRMSLHGSFHGPLGPASGTPWLPLKWWCASVLWERLISFSSFCFLLQIFTLFHQHYVLISRSPSVWRAEKTALYLIGSIQEETLSRFETSYSKKVYCSYLIICVLIHSVVSFLLLLMLVLLLITTVPFYCFLYCT